MEDILEQQAKPAAPSQKKGAKLKKEDFSDLPGAGLDDDFPSYNQLDAFGLDTADKKKKTKVIKDVPVVKDKEPEEEKTTETYHQNINIDKPEKLVQLPQETQ